MKDATLAIHGSEVPDSMGSVTQGIFTASTYEWESFEEEPKWVYGRTNHPNRAALENVVAALEGGTLAVAFASGMAAINAALELAYHGDHILVANDIYGGTFMLGREVLPRHGVEVGFFDSLQPETISTAVKGNTRFLIFETPTNPTLRIADIQAVVSKAKEHNLTVIFDNTFATPLLQKPLTLGVDVVCHSTTKYLGGHSDVVGGVVVTNSEDIHQKLFSYAVGGGGIPGPFDCWITVRGIKSLVPRMKMHCENAQKVAQFLASHPRVRRVNYPGLPGHPGHDLAKRQMAAYGAMVSFEIDGTVEDVLRFGKRAKVFKMAASLGGVESLISYPSKMSHVGLTEKERIERGIPDTLMRLSIGIEDPDDLMSDLSHALQAG